MFFKSKTIHKLYNFTKCFNTAAIPMSIINDIPKFKITSNYSREERLLRCKLASLYRLVHCNKWNHGIYNHISAAIRNKEDDRLSNFLINPFGLLYSEVTASGLVKIDEHCNVIDQGTTAYGVNKAGFVLHAAIHKARKDINFIIHLHTPVAVSIACSKTGLLPISQEALMCGNISYHDYTGILLDEQIQKRLADDLGPVNKIMILRNHGYVICGETIEEAWHYLYNFIQACQVQCLATSSSFRDQIILASDDARKQVLEITSQGGGGANSNQSETNWKLGELEFEAMMRQLDSQGLQTGYPYKFLQPLVDATTAKQN